MKISIFLSTIIFSFNCFSFTGERLAAVFKDERFAKMNFKSIDSIIEIQRHEDGRDNTEFLIIVDGSTCIPATVSNIGTITEPKYILAGSSIIKNCNRNH